LPFAPKRFIVETTLASAPSDRGTMRRLQWLPAAATALLITTGCEYQSLGITMEPPPKPLRLSTPDATYSLASADRAKLRRGFDADALERLLRMVRPDMRQEILGHFQLSDGTGRRYGDLVQFHDPRLQPLLEEVWAPMWDEVGATDEQIAQNAFHFPGRDIARQRRAAARAHPHHQRNP
jgi:hypothetical protein